MKSALTLLPAALLAACASAPAKPEAPLVPYTCNGDPTSLTADYYNANAKNVRVILHVYDNNLTLKQVPSASGVRYTDARTDPTPVGSKIWWTKGSEAMLYEVSKRADGNTYEKQLANCTSTPRPVPMYDPATLPVPQPLPGTIPGTAPGIMNAPVSNPTATI